MTVDQIALAAAATVSTPGPGRFGANVALVIAVAGVALGVLALARADSAAGRLGALAAAPLGLTGVVLGAVHTARTSDLGLGTGNGLAGAVIAIVAGLIAVALGGVALSRTRRHAH